MSLDYKILSISETHAPWDVVAYDVTIYKPWLSDRLMNDTGIMIKPKESRRVTVTEYNKIREFINRMQPLSGIFGTK